MKITSLNIPDRPTVSSSATWAPPAGPVHSQGFGTQSQAQLPDPHLVDGQPCVAGRVGATSYKTRRRREVTPTANTVTNTKPAGSGTAVAGRTSTQFS